MKDFKTTTRLVTLRCQINGGGWEISENLNKREGQINGGRSGNLLKNLIPGRATKKGSHDTIGRACCGV